MAEAGCDGPFPADSRARREQVWEDSDDLVDVLDVHGWRAPNHPETHRPRSPALRRRRPCQRIRRRCVRGPARVLAREQVARGHEVLRVEGLHGPREARLQAPQRGHHHLPLRHPGRASHRWCLVSHRARERAADAVQMGRDYARRCAHRRLCGPRGIHAD
uniref:Uncharacterized protein n=1 Tax=uncultured marine virus TaxID=186617 RepID=A0A0F7L8G7_9VIRU|nr:hypothetical protein [uncultured marine virus]